MNKLSVSNYSPPCWDKRLDSILAYTCMTCNLNGNQCLFSDAISILISSCDRREKMVTIWLDGLYLRSYHPSLYKEKISMLRHADFLLNLIHKQTLF